MSSVINKPLRHTDSEKPWAYFVTKRVQITSYGEQRWCRQNNLQEKPVQYSLHKNKRRYSLHTISTDKPYEYDEAKSAQKIRTILCSTLPRHKTYRKKSFMENYYNPIIQSRDNMWHIKFIGTINWDRDSFMVLPYVQKRWILFTILYANTWHWYHNTLLLLLFYLATNSVHLFW